MRNRNEGTRATTQLPRRAPAVGPGLGALRDEMNHLMDRFSGFRRTGWPGESLWSLDPFGETAWGSSETLGRTDLSETEEAYELEIDLPGMKPDDVDVQVSDGILTISGERKDEREDKRKGYHLSERTYGAVSRSFRLPDSVAADAIKAGFSDGVLTVTLPKSPEAKKQSRKIDINPG